MPDPGADSLVGLLQRSSLDHGDRPAVVDRTRVLSYVQLDGLSNQIARLLRDRGVGPGDLVGLHVEKSAEAVAGIYGVLKAGAAYVPLDPAGPGRRLTTIARDADVKLILVGAETKERWSLVVQGAAAVRTVVVLNASSEISDELELGTRCEVVGREALDRQSTAALPGRAACGADLAYVLYTSGSTGSPKGVMLTHGNALAFVGWAARQFDLGPDDRLSSHAPLHFDLSIFDLFAAASVGAAVVLIPRPVTMFPAELVQLVRQQEMSVWYSVPSALVMMVLRGGLDGVGLPGMRLMLFAGEVFPNKHLRRLMALVPQARFANLYGPTETNVCAWHEVDVPPPEEGDPVPIGNAITDTELFVVNDRGEIAGPDEVGELHVQGPTVMRGYWRDPVRTEASLIRLPCSPRPAEAAYRTGDFVRRDRAGQHRLVGRKDHQIKTRGHRVELGEIEAVLDAHPAIAECAVLALPDELVTNRLAAVVVGDEQLVPRDLARFCGERLPAYMVPERFEFRSSLPKTSTGKADRQELTSQLARSPSPRAQRRVRGEPVR